MWGVNEEMKNHKGFIVIPLLIIALIAVTGIVCADGFQVESAPCPSANDIYQLSSDNLTFNFTDLTPVTKRFYISDRAGILPEYISDNYSGNLSYWDSVTELADNFSQSPDNYLTFTFPGPGKYLLKWVAWNGSNPDPEKCIPIPNVSTEVYAKFPINGLINQTGSTYNYQARLKFNISSNSSNPDTLDWNFGDGTSLHQTDYPNAFNHTYPSSSPYTTVNYLVNVTARNNTPLVYSDNFTTYSLTMYPPPASDFNITDNFTHLPIGKGPAPVTADFNYNSSTFDPSVIMTPEWNLSDGSAPFSSENFTYVFDTPGVFNVTLKTSTMYGWNITNHTLMVYDNITSNFTSVQYPCAAFPVNVTFRDNSSGSNRDYWAWDFGDGTSTGNTEVNWTNHTYYSPQLYNVTLLASNKTYSISNLSSQWIDVQGLYANFTWDPVNRTIDRGTNGLFNFTDTSSGINIDTRWIWEFEPNKYSYIRNDSYNFTRNGTYNVSLTVYNPNCGDSSRGNKTTKQVSVYENLYANISYSPTCGSFPLTVQFLDNSTDTPDTWLWRFYYLNGSYYDIPNIRNPTFVYPTPGTYQVDLTTGNLQNKWDVRNFYVTLTDCMQANFTANRTRGYFPLTVNFTDVSTPSSSISSRIWNFGDQSTATQGSVDHTFSQKGNFNVTLTVTDTTGQVKVANKTIEVGSPVYANFTPNGSAAVPVNTSMIVQFTDLSVPQNDITNWNWNFDDILPNDTNKSPFHTFTSEGLHNVTLNVSNPYYGATSVMRSQINISVQKAPEAGFTFSPEVVNPYEWVFFSDTSKGQEINTWLWQFGDGNTSSETNPKYQYQNAGSYTVNLVVSNPYGNSTASHVVRVKGPVIADFETDPSGWGVVNQPVTFIDTSLGQPISWIWNFGDGNTTTTSVNPISHTYTSSGWYTINMTGTNWDGQSGSAVRQIQIEDKARPRDVNFDVAGMKYSGVHPLTVQFVDQTPSQSNVTEWYWDFGDRTNAFNTTPVAPSHTYMNPGQYTVTLTVRNDAGVNEKIRVAYVVVV
ncbi:MAG: hypothetical protein CVV33_01175 [Methanomicrobiales archaeon HGW-Methanomicrobiales-4]|nr:MAG: hypothetical protein CVV33_01175 [Methanomicrobiales archaeon HGW-Methanomicrobiales-4]